MDGEPLIANLSEEERQRILREVYLGWTEQAQNQADFYKRMAEGSEKKEDKQK